MIHFRVRSRSLTIAQHEAAHVVVGVALGLRLREVAVGPGTLAMRAWEGYAWFYVPRGARMAWALTCAAGVAWERATRGPGADAGDLAELRRMGFRGRGVDALATAAAAIVESRRVAHTRVTRALMDRDLNTQDIATIACGGRPPAELY